MPRKFSFQPYRPGPPRPGPRRPPSERVDGRPDCAGDPPLEFGSLALGVEFRFDADFARRLILREVNAKEACTVRDAAGVYYRASVRELGPGGGVAVPYERCARPPESELEITLACAVLARQRMLLVAQKAVELGVARLVPLLTERSVPLSGLAHEKAHAWPGQVRRAAKQCRRSSLPEIRPPARLADFLAGADFTAADARLVLDDAAASAPSVPAGMRRVALIVGPEGGFSDAERLALKERAQTWNLGGRVLRAETAVLVGLAAVQTLWGDFRTG